MNTRTVIILPVLLAILLSACASTPEPAEVRRYHAGDWEQDIGYTQAVRHGNILHVSGVVTGGDTMDEVVTNTYRRIESILAEFDADMDDIVKEVLYTTDMEAMKKAIPVRKAFFPNGIYPAATWVQISRLFVAEAVLEVDVTVMLDQ